MTRSNLATWGAFAAVALTLTSPTARAQGNPGDERSSKQNPTGPTDPPEADAPSGPSESADALEVQSQTDEAPKELTPPRLVQGATPTYPTEAQEEALAGQVVLEIDIDVDGQVTNASVVSAEPAGYGFESAALEAAQKLRFLPATEGGDPIPVRIEYRFRFVPDVPAAAEKTEPPGPAAASQQVAQRMGELTGQLRERGTRLPLVGVKVTVFRGEGEDAVGFETETDATGRFSFADLIVGRWRLLADPEGYYPIRATEEVADTARTEVRYTIERSAYNPYDVVVDAKRVRREVNRTTISAKQAERVPGTFGDVLAVVQNLPGVARSPALSGEVIVRGSAPEDSQAFINGMAVPIVYHFGGLRSVMPVGMVESIDFYPGNFSVEYGRATGGVIDVGIKQLQPKKVGGYVDLSLLDASLYLEVPVTDQLAIAVAGRRSYVGDVIAQTLGSDAGNIVAPRYYDSQALISYKPSPAHELEVFFLLSDDLFELALDEPVAADAEQIVSDIGLSTSFYRAIVDYSYVPSERLDNQLKLSFGRDRFNFNLGQDLTFDVDLTQVQLRDTLRYALNDALAVRVGVDGLLQDSTGQARLPNLPQEGDPAGPEGDNVRLNEGVDTNLTREVFSGATFAELELSPFEGTLMVPGVRLEYFSLTKELTLSPRVTLRQQLHPQWTIKGGAGLFIQEPDIIEMSTELGNPDLDTEKAMHYSVGVEYTPLDYLTLDVTGFYKTLNDQVSATDAVVLEGDDTRPLVYDNGGRGRVVGLELLARHNLYAGFSGWVAYTLSRAQRRDSGSDSYRLFDYDQTHIFTAVGSYQLPRNWEVSTRFRYVTGNVYTPATGAVYDADADAYSALYGSVNSDRLEAFYQVDFRIDKRWVFDSWMLNAYLDIQNVTNRANLDGISYNYNFTETEDGNQGLPLTPVLGLRGEF